MSILFGAIADDFTGATDLANTLVKAGMPTVQLIGTPQSEPDLGDARAVVIALKSRTAKVADAVKQSLEALEWLLAHGAGQILFKYCSTFDSTKKGNIGPVADALMDAMGERFSIICPAFPENGRSIYMGNLFVGEVPLAESSMRDHPLTPMNDSNLVRLMSAQSTRGVGLVSQSVVSQGPKAVKQSMAALEGDGFSYAVLDAISNSDLMVLGEALKDVRFLTGGSGIAMGLPENFLKAGLLKGYKSPEIPAKSNRALILAGSCSVATLSQIDHAKSVGWPVLKLEIDRCLNPAEYCECVASWAIDQTERDPVLVYASSSPDEVKKIQQKYGSEAAGKMIEETLSGVAVRLADQGFCNIIAAGGETSGAVVSGLGVKKLEICAEIQPGVPWTRSGENGEIALALKSGNFGTQDFFEKAIGMLQ